MDKQELARMIDHTILKPDAQREDVLKVCSEAKEFGFASVCVNPSFVPLVRDQLAGTRVKVCTVIGFPLGATFSETKAAETREAVRQGADEIDMVINIGALKDGRDDMVRRDIEGVVQAAEGKLVKVIIETCLLTEEEKVRACRLAKEAGAHFVKTSTGFSKAGATEEDIRLMRRTVGEQMGVKASGGVRTFEDAMAMIEAGANRIGASASVRIVAGFQLGDNIDY